MKPIRHGQRPAARVAASASWGARCATRGSLSNNARNLDQKGAD